MSLIARGRRRTWLMASVSLVTVAAGAAVAAAAVTGGGGRPPGRPRSAASHTALAIPGLPVRYGVSRAHAAPGTVLTGCGTQAGEGALGAHWQSGAAAHAGPLWVMDGGHSGGPVRLYVAVVVLRGIQPGSAVVVRAAASAQPDLRFLFGPGDSLDPGVRYTMASGESGVTFVACARGAAGTTEYYGGFLVRGARCVPVLAEVPGRRRPVRIGLGACRRH